MTQELDDKVAELFNRAFDNAEVEGIPFDKLVRAYVQWRGLQDKDTEEHSTITLVYETGNVEYVNE